MPYSCAKAVCATFCYHIAGALIPIFGPDFPSECLNPQSTDFARMVIDQTLVVRASREMEEMRDMYHRNPEDEIAAPLLQKGSAYSEALESTPRRDAPSPQPASERQHAVYAVDTLRARPLATRTLGESPGLPPLSYVMPRPRTCLTFPPEHDRLPPLSQIAPLSPVILPPLFDRERPDRMARSSHLPYSSRLTSSGQGRHRHHISMSSIESDEKADFFTRIPRSDSQLRSLPDTVSRPIRRPRDTASSPPSRASLISTHRCERGSSSFGYELPGTDRERLESSFCYPSPPRRQYTGLYCTETDQNRPHPLSDPVRDNEESAILEQRLGRNRAIGLADALVLEQRQSNKNDRKGNLNAAGSGLRLSGLASPWNTIDADAAEVLVNFGVKPKSSSGDEQGRDSDDGSLYPPMAAEAGKIAGPRFDASIASLLCDDEAPRPKRRRS